MVVSYNLYGKKHGFDLAERGVLIPAKKLGKSILLAVIVAIASYACVFVIDYLFKADFRFWTLAIKAFDVSLLRYFFPGVILFLVYYVANSVSANSFNYNTIGGKHPVINNVIVSVFAALPALIIPWIQYITYYTTNHTMWPRTDAVNWPMFVLWLFPMVLILFTTTFISRYIYKLTKNPYIAGIINGIIVTVMTITNTCTNL